MLNFFGKNKKQPRAHSKEPKTATLPIPGISKASISTSAIDPLKLTRYFRLTLKEADLKAPDFKESQEFIKAPFHAERNEPSIEEGRLSLEHTETLFHLYLRANENADVSKGIGVQISLATFYDATATQGAHCSLFVLPAILQQDGTLLPDWENLPWINIKYLHREGVPDKELMIGGKDALKRFWSFTERDGKDLESSGKDWKDFLKYAQKLFRAVSGEKLDNWAKKKNKELENRGNADPSETQSKVTIDTCYVVQDNRIVASTQIQKLYKHLEEKRKFPKLYLSLISASLHKRALGSETLAGRFVPCFTGTMNDEFPLTDSQRIAVRGFFSGNNGEVTAVSGPPGTGKTTMLQAIVASTLVNHALNKENPPLIVGTSTNNQAVTNIIDSFASVGKDDPTIWEHRWIVEAPENYDGKSKLTKPLRPLAVYCTSNDDRKKDAKAKGYLTENHRTKIDTFGPYSESGYASQALERYLDFASEAFGQRFLNSKQVQQAIYQRLKKINDACLALVSAFSEYSGSISDYKRIESCISSLEDLHAMGTTNEKQQLNVEKLKDLCKSIYIQPKQQILKELDCLIDVTARYALFWLAVHYYEAEWVGHKEDNSYLDEKQLNKNTPTCMDEYWTQATALTPCYVMTEYQIPNWLKIYKNKEDHFDTERIDLLIVDEAGQVDTAVGAAAFALAKKAIVVGDENQLSPIWAMDTEIDRFRLSSMGLGKQADRLVSHGLTCSEPSSIMRAASFASNWCYGPNKEGEMLPGLFLAEHFRCHPLIINFCNELLYDGMLKPRRPMPGQIVKQLEQKAAEGNQLSGEPEHSDINEKGYKLLGVVDNPLLFVTVEGSKSQRVGGSRKNEAEAKAIAAWIEENGKFFTDIYNKELGEAIAVVTPFSSQARCISQELKNRIGSWNAKKITVGTAHRLQGAERPIVLFSCVYGDDDANASFIDNTLELMNVAVSRAKDLFVIFGSKTRWEDRGTTFRLVNKLASKSDGVFAVTSPMLQETYKVDAFTNIPQKQMSAVDDRKEAIENNSKRKEESRQESQSNVPETPERPSGLKFVPQEFGKYQPDFPSEHIDLFLKVDEFLRAVLGAKRKEYKSYVGYKLPIKHESSSHDVTTRVLPNNEGVVVRFRPLNQEFASDDDLCRKSNKESQPWEMELSNEGDLERTFNILCSAF